jgi:hypothetical protein
MAYIRKRGKKYHVEINLTGLKPIYASFETRRQATDFARKVEGDKKLQQQLGGISESIPDLIKLFLEQYTKKDKSLGQRLEFWIKELGDVPAVQVTPDMIRKIKRTFLANGRAGSIFNRYKSNLLSVYTWAELPNPCREVRSETEGKGRKRVFTEERNAILKQAKKDEWNKFWMQFNSAAVHPDSVIVPIGKRS